MMENLVIYRNVCKLCKSYTMIFQVAKIKKCSLIIGRSFSITLDRREYMPLVQFNWTVHEVVLLMQTKISWKIGEMPWITIVIGIPA